MNLLERFRRHVEYSIERDKWARRAIALLDEGKDEEADEAIEKAEYWELKAKSLEP